MRPLLAKFSQIKIHPGFDEKIGRYTADSLIIGPFILDVAVFGLRSRMRGKGVCTVFEIDGDVHDLKKISKDTYMELSLKEIGIDVIRILNQYVYENGIEKNLEKMILGFASSFKVPVKKKAMLALKRRIALRNIAAWLDLDECDELLRKQFNTEFYLVRGFDFVSNSLHKKPNWFRAVKFSEDNAT